MIPSTCTVHGVRGAFRPHYLRRLALVGHSKIQIRSFAFKGPYKREYSDEEKKLFNAEMKRKRLERWRTGTSETTLSKTKAGDDMRVVWTRKKDRKHLKSDLINKDLYWRDYDDNARHYEEAVNRRGKPTGRYKPQPIENQGSAWRYDMALKEDIRNPRDNIQPIGVQRAIHHMFKTDPKKWTVQKLSSNFGLSVQQVKRYIQNCDHEEQIEASGETIDDSLQTFVEKIFKVAKPLTETRTYLSDVYNPYTRTFGYSLRSRLFGSVEDDVLKNDLGNAIPRLQRREVPLDGPGSGKPLNCDKLPRVRQNMIITDITHIGKMKRTDISIPSMVRQRDGTLRHLNVAELARLRRREIGTQKQGKFSPH